MDEQAILKKIDAIKEIPTLPAIVFELNTYLQDRGAPGQQMAASPGAGRYDFAAP